MNGFKPHRTTNSEIMSLVAKKQLLERNFEEQSQDGNEEIETEIIETPIIEAVNNATEKSVKAEDRVDEDDEDFFLTYYNDNKEDFA